MKNIYLLAVSCLLLLSSFAAWGHAFPKKQIPSPDAILTKSPTIITIQFNAFIEPYFSTLRVIDSHGKQVSIGKGTVNQKDATILSVGVPSLAKDKYQVYWKSVARDGHTTQGHYQFSIQ